MALGTALAGAGCSSADDAPATGGGAAATAADTSPAPAPAAPGAIADGSAGGVFAAGEAGTVALAVGADGLRLVAAGANPGWESAVGLEAKGVAVTFTRGGGDRVDFTARAAGGVIVAAVCARGDGAGAGTASLSIGGVGVTTDGCLSLA